MFAFDIVLSVFINLRFIQYSGTNQVVLLVVCANILILYILSYFFNLKIMLDLKKKIFN